MIDASEIPFYQAVFYSIAEASLVGYVLIKEVGCVVNRVRRRAIEKEREMFAKMIHYLNSDDITSEKIIAIGEMLLMAGDRERARIVWNFMRAFPEQFPETDQNFNELEEKLN